MKFVGLTARFSNLESEVPSLDAPLDESRPKPPELDSREVQQVRRQRCLTPAETQELIAHYHQGARVPELMEIWGVGRTTVLRIFNRNGVETRWRPRQTMTDDERVEAAGL